MELEQLLLQRKDMETELLTLTASMADVLQQGHAEAESLASGVQATSDTAMQVTSSAPSLGSLARLPPRSVLRLAPLPP